MGNNVQTRAPDFINPNIGNDKRVKRDNNWRCISAIALGFLAVIFIASFLYYWASPRGWGIQPTFASALHTESIITYSDCLYFSVVTITTLGYGDFRPESWGKLIASLEVLSGILLTGIFISNLVSQQQERLLKRVASGLINIELQDFREMILELVAGFNGLPILSNRNYVQLRSELLNRSAGLTQSMARYWRYESNGKDFYAIAPKKAVARVLGDLYGLLNTVILVIKSDSFVTLPEEDRKSIRNITESILYISRNIGDKGDPDNPQTATLNQIYAIIPEVRERFKLVHSDRNIALKV